MNIQRVSNNGSFPSSNTHKLGLGTIQLNGKTYKVTAVYSGSSVLSDASKANINRLANNLMKEVQNSHADFSQHKVIKVDSTGIYSKDTKIQSHNAKTTKIWDHLRSELLSPKQITSTNITDQIKVPAPSKRKSSSSHVNLLSPSKKKSRLKLFNKSDSPSAVPEAKKVGKLGRKWRYHSDHLPVGAMVDGFQVASWNVLNTAYIDNLKKERGGGYNAGLNGSKITTSKYRDVTVGNDIVNMAKTHPIIALQEMNPKVIRNLQKRLPHMQFIMGTNSGDREVLLVDKRKFDVADFSVQDQKSFQNQPHTFVQAKVRNKTTGKYYRFVTTRLQGFQQHNVNSRHELKSYLEKKCGKETPLIVLGDMNCGPEDMPMPAGFDPYNKYNNHVSTGLGDEIYSRVFDHIWINKRGSQDTKAAASPASAFGPLVEESANILN